MDGASISHNPAANGAQILLIAQDDQDAGAQSEAAQRFIAPGQPLLGSPLGLRSIKEVCLSDNGRAKIQNLLDIVNERLTVMPEMAQLKLRLEQPILDEQREAAVLEAALAYAKSIDLNADLASRFVQAQMDIARQLQREVTEPAGLDRDTAEQQKRVLREQLLDLTPRMLDALKAIQDDLPLAPFKAAVQGMLAHQGQGPLRNPTIQNMILAALYASH